MSPGINVQGVGAVDITLWKKDLGGDQGDAQGPDGITQSGGATYHEDDDETLGRRRVGVSSSIGGDELHGDPPHQIIH